MDFLRCIKKRIGIIILLPILFFFSSCSQPERTNPNTNTNHQTDSLIRIAIDSAYVFYGKGLYEKCDSVVSKAQTLQTNTSDTTLRLTLLFIQTELLKQKGNYDDCILNYYEAVKLSKLTQDSMRLGLSYYNLSSIHILNQRLEQAEDYCLKAIPIFSNIQDSVKLSNCFVQLSIIYKNKPDYPKAKTYLNQAIQYYEYHDYQLNLSICLNNLGNILLDENLLDEAIPYYKKAVSISKSLNSSYALAIRWGNLGELFLQKQNYKTAKLYIDSSMVIAKKIEAKETILSNYERLKHYYLSQNKLDSAIAYAEKFTQLKVKLSQLESSKIVEELENKHQNELQLISAQAKIDILEKDKLVKQKDQERTLLIFIFIIILVVLVAVSIYIFYRKQNRIAKMNAEIYEKEKAFLESQQKLDLEKIKNKEIEKQQLEKELEYKNKEIVNFALQIVEKNEFLEELLNKIKQSEQSKSQREVIQFIKQNTLLDNEKEEFQANIEQLNEAFFFKLKAQFPNLTKDEERLSALLRINLSSKEISAILNISPSSVDMKRYRLRKKLQLTKEENIINFLNNIK